MNRDLKFRAWDKINKKWLNLFQLKLSTDGSLLAVEDIDGEIYGLHQVEIVEYTGLKDSKGKEVYEGDILKWEYPAGYSLAEVLFGDFDNGKEYEDNESGIGWYIREHEHYISESGKQKDIENSIRITGIKGYPLDTYVYEVIGNIYEGVKE